MSNFIGLAIDRSNEFVMNIFKKQYTERIFRSISGFAIQDYQGFSEIFDFGQLICDHPKTDMKRGNGPC